MKVRRTTISLFCLLISIFIIYTYLKDQEQVGQQDRFSSIENKPSAYVQNGHFILYDSQGNSTTLSSKNALFFENTDEIEIESTMIEMPLASNQTLTLHAKSGHYDPKQEIFLLEGNVEISPKDQTDKPWSLKGSEFRIDIKQHFISSKQAVTIRQDKTVLTAIGLNAWTEDKKIELLSNVRGKYVFSKN